MRRFTLITRYFPLFHPSAGCFQSTEKKEQGNERHRKWSCDSPLDETCAEELEKDASQRGFMRRDSANSKVYMEETLPKPERISGGVAVMNLPPMEKERTEFDVYQRSTRDYTSQVTPYGTVGVGLGAGFGAREDKRLGFLRPRKLQPFGGESSIVPKYDENGMPIDESLTREQLIKKRLAYMKSFEGTTMSHREHFLLVDLDFEKDAMIFGTTREEFERNVTRLKQVISEYSRWERTDNFYLYSTIVLKILTAWVLLECIQQYYELQLFSIHYDDFVEATEETLNSLAYDLERDMKRAREELIANPPDFRPVVEAVRREKRRLLDEDAKRVTKETPVVDSSGSEEAKERNATDGVSLASQLDDIIPACIGGDGCPKQPLEGTVVPLETSALNRDVRDDDALRPHPMDTTQEKLYLDSLRRREAQKEMRRLQDQAVDAGPSVGVFGSFWQWVRGGGNVVITPLLQEDFTRLSYAASPTSIETLRSIRRILLPRSEDHIQVVREEMLEYKREKELRCIHHSSDQE
ncbi:hypothetical protein, conserved [Trypanosoma brucei gambiense DAL972]|uniref:Uncharacterized protein n=2 Tax=Trypanosoma brucei TaxID=5691 RepID=C9ZJT1_TRYB9|nr:hypothetical protein, conserved [Trypanosoma brucei gambiense DAL972]RHW74053.1 hypothetical protein DPX39_020027800 [Trypanosoma brucei equiperdum]CBH09641.1 hypothetical protein, conserved [Trypanosoma brucei gambiense DAL972]|eukprot:XP_011771945.1 hypothetical protein, conserved [Trypanosoma brucei gambiense DAL972]